MRRPILPCFGELSPERWRGCCCFFFEEEDGTTVDDAVGVRHKPIAAPSALLEADRGTPNIFLFLPQAAEEHSSALEPLTVPQPTAVHSHEPRSPSIITPGPAKTGGRASGMHTRDGGQ